MHVFFLGGGGEIAGVPDGVVNLADLNGFTSVSISLSIIVNSYDLTWDLGAW